MNHILIHPKVMFQSAPSSYGEPPSHRLIATVVGQHKGTHAQCDGDCHRNRALGVEPGNLVFGMVDMRIWWI